MGLFDKIFGKNKAAPRAQGYFDTLTAYTPVFTTWQGSLYESELVRAAIDARARHISKLQITITGSSQPALQARLRRAPNSWMTWSQFLYRVSTILDVNNTAFIVPVFDDRPGRLDVIGYYPVLPAYVEIVDVQGEPYLRYSFASGDKAAVPLAKCCVLTKYQYKKDFFGESNIEPLHQTMDMLNTINQGVINAIKDSSTLRFYASSPYQPKDGDAAKESKRFTETQFKSDEHRAVLLFPPTYQNIQQVDTSAYQVDTDQIEYIRTNVYNYFGVSEEVLQNKAQGAALDAFFNGAIEPFSIQFSEAMTRAMFSDREQEYGARLLANANRLQYMDVSQKITMVQQLSDRGIITIDEARALFNYDPLPDGAGEHAPIRGEYYMVGEGKEKKEEENEKEGGEEDADNTE